MERDPVRQKLKDLLWKRGLTMAAASLALGRNRAYMHQYLERGLPKVLNYPDSVTLGVAARLRPGRAAPRYGAETQAGEQDAAHPPGRHSRSPSIRGPRNGRSRPPPVQEL